MAEYRLDAIAQQAECLVVLWQFIHGVVTESSLPLPFHDDSPPTVSFTVNDDFSIGTSERHVADVIRTTSFLWNTAQFRQ